MTRITKHDVNVQIGGINEVLAQMNATYRLALHGRNGYSVIDRVKATDQYCVLGDRLVAGTMRDCYNYAVAMLRGMWMVRGEY